MELSDIFPAGLNNLSYSSVVLFRVLDKYFGSFAVGWRVRVRVGQERLKISY